MRSNERDPFFSYVLVEVRFGQHMGHIQRTLDKLVQSEPHVTEQNQNKPVYIGIPIALCLFILFLLLIFLLMRRRNRKALQVTLVRDPDYVADVIGGMETHSMDRIVVRFLKPF